MFIQQEIFEKNAGWTTTFQKQQVQNPQLVLAFGNRTVITKHSIYEKIKTKYPSADVVICSTSGEIMDTSVLDDSIVLTAIEFEKTEVKTCRVNIDDYQNSFDAGKVLVERLFDEQLQHVFVVSDGQKINGSELVKGLNQMQDVSISATGGLAGDGYDFNKTLVGLNENIGEGNIVGIGFYGKNLQVGFGSMGGWDAFGPERVVTRSHGNVLYEVDNQNALELYKKYLGDAASELPSSALFYPLSIRTEENKEPIVRTILSIREEDQSMIFAGDIPEGSIARLMKHNADKLIDGAEAAAATSLQKLINQDQPDLAILVSCVGRKIVLGQNIEEEVEVIKDLVGTQTAITGFYSYGEIAPFKFLTNCQLHNQTMTITTFTETLHEQKN